METFFICPKTGEEVNKSYCKSFLKCGGYLYYTDKNRHKGRFKVISGCKYIEICKPYNNLQEYKLTKDEVKDTTVFIEEEKI